MASGKKSASSAHCSAINCTNRQSKRPDLSFFRFPKNKERCQQWVQNTRRQDLLKRTPLYLTSNCRICAAHFELDQFSNGQTKNRLKWNAVPTLFDIPNPPKPLSTGRRSIKRENKNLPPTERLPKKQKVTDNIHGDHPYCMYRGPEDVPPSASSSNTEDPPLTPTVKQNKMLKKERQRNFRLRKRVEHLRKSMEEVTTKSKTVNDLITQAGEFLQESALSFFASQLRNSSGRRRARGRRWTYSDKVVALSLYHQSPRAYLFCQRIFTLPSVSSLRRWLSSLELRPGFSPKVFDLLNDRVSIMKEMDKFCVVSFDEMSLRVGLSYNITEDAVEGFEDFGTLGKTQRVANHALVFMVRGLTGKWKQPLGYFLSEDCTTADKLEILSKECLQKVKDIGLQPKAIVCDQGSSNVRLYKDLGITEDHPFFTHGDSKIFCMHDPPHLLKNTRSNLEKYVFAVSGQDGSLKHIRWSYIRNFYEYDSALPIRKAHKLTKGHFVLNSFSKMRVNKAAQVLSHSVAAGIYTYSALGKLPGEAVHTAEFIELIDGLFDAFNSRFFKDAKKLKRPISVNSAHHSFFESDCLPVLRNLRVIGAKNIMFLKGWRLAISCVSQLWQDIKENTNIRFLFTSRLNQDIVENLFSTIRRKGGFRDNPSAKEFRCAFRMVMMAELIKPAVGANCTPDTDKFILTLQTLTKYRIQKPCSLSPVHRSVRSNSTLYCPLDIPKMNTLSYIAGHICRKILTPHEVLSPCHTCRGVLLKPSAQLDDPSLLFIHHKAYDTSASEFGSLMVPSELFVAFCEVCENVFRAEFNDIKMTRNNISHLLNQALCNTQEYNKMKLCSERINRKIVSLLVNIRIYYGLKYKNRELHDLTVKRKCRKVQKVSHK